MHGRASGEERSGVSGGEKPEAGAGEGKGRGMAEED